MVSEVFGADVEFQNAKFGPKRSIHFFHVAQRLLKDRSRSLVLIVLSCSMHVASWHFAGVPDQGCNWRAISGCIHVNSDGRLSAKLELGSLETFGLSLLRTREKLTSDSNQSRAFKSMLTSCIKTWQAHCNTQSLTTSRICMNYPLDTWPAEWFVRQQVSLRHSARAEV